MSTQYRTTWQLAGEQSAAWTDIPAFAAGFMAAMVSLAALVVALGASLFTTLMFALLVMGFGISWLVGAGELSRALKNVIVGIIVFGSLIAIAVDPAVNAMIMYPASMPSNDPRVAGFLAWLVVVYSYNLSSTRAVLFMCVPALSLIGLVASLASAEGILPYFTIFLALACFIMMRQNVFSDRESSAAAEASSVPGTTRSHVRLTAGITVAALIVGIAVGTLVFRGMDRLFMSRWISMYRMPFMEHFSPRSHAEISSGPTGQSEQEVMTVESDEGMLWRGQVFDQYTGHGWSNTRYWDNSYLIRPEMDPSGITEISQDGNRYGYVFLIPDDPLVGKRSPVKMVEQTFRVTYTRHRMVYGAAEPRIVAFDRTQPYLLVGSELGTRHSFGKETSYKVLSEVSTASGQELADASEDYPDEIMEQYLSVPESTWEVKALAERVTSDAATAYDKVIAIRGFLQDNFKYELRVPPAPVDRDAVAHFLFESKRGYCDIFSSSMVIMCRQLGIPARWVTGFTEGDYDSKDGLYHVKAKHAHAWTEVFFPGYGWIQFDPTPAGEDGALSKKAITASLKKLIYKIRAEWPTVVTGMVIFFLAVYLVKTELLDRIYRRRRAAGHPGRTSPAYETYRRMCRVLARFGLPKSPEVTPSEYAATLSQWFEPRFREVADSVSLITADFEESRYAYRDLPRERIDAGIDRLHGLLRDLRQAKRQRLLPKTS